MQLATDRWERLRATVLAVAAGVGVLLSGGLVWSSTEAAFSGPTTNPGNTWAAGAVSLADDDSGAASFAASDLRPGDGGSRCITVTYTGTTDAGVTVRGAVSGALGPYLRWSVQEGTGGGFGSCTGFSATSVPYAGTVSDFATGATNFASGYGLFAPLRQGEQRTYRLSYRLDDAATTAAQGQTAGLTITWEAQNLTFTPAVAFGANGQGQLGVGDSTARLSPTAVGAETGWSQLSAGMYHTCAVRADRTLWCWGYNASYRLGLNDTTTRTAPARVGTDSDWASVAAGAGHTCGIKTDGGLWCWGANSYGQLGLNDTTIRQVPVRVGSATDWAHVATGAYHTCGIRTTGALWCWGYNPYGQLGQNDQTDRPTPTVVGADTTWSAISLGNYFTCGIRAGGELYCWGANANGQIGANDLDDHWLPARVGSATDWATVSAGGNHVCGVRSNGTLWCWGRGFQGQLGNGDTSSSRQVPDQVGTATTWAAVSTGNRHTCGISRTRALSCWGHNDTNGVLGTGGTTASSTPVQIRTDVRAAEASEDYTHVLLWPS